MPATHLADTSAWAQLHRSEVAARLVSLLVGGGAATCGVVDLEVLGAIQDPQELALAVEERRMFPQAPIDDEVLAWYVTYFAHIGFLVPLSDEVLPDQPVEPEAVVD